MDRNVHKFGITGRLGPFRAPKGPEKGPKACYYRLLRAAGLVDEGRGPSEGRPDDLSRTSAAAIQRLHPKPPDDAKRRPVSFGAALDGCKLVRRRSSDLRHKPCSPPSWDIVIQEGVCEGCSIPSNSFLYNNIVHACMDCTV